MKSLVWTCQPFQRKIRQNFFDSELNNLKALEAALGLKVECGSYIAIARIFVNKSPTFFLGDVGRVTQPGFSHCKTGCCSFFGNTCEYH